MFIRRGRFSIARGAVQPAMGALAGVSGHPIPRRAGSEPGAINQDPQPALFLGAIEGRHEREVLQLLADGKVAKEVATALDVSVFTVDAHRDRM